MMESYTLLVIARSQLLAKRLRDVLDAGQYIIRWASSSTQALTLDLRPSLLILDTPSSGGARSVARLKREFEVPLLALLRAHQPVPEQADAHLSRISRTQELVESIEAALLNHSPHMLCVDEMCLDTETRRFQLNGTLHHLPPIATRILAVLMTRPGQVVPRDELFRRVWRTNDGDSTRALDVHIASLRRRLETNPRHPKLIVTERGVGYRLQPPA
jgi:DNA-binding response OmpR family regulator